MKEPGSLSIILKVYLSYLSELSDGLIDKRECANGVISEDEPSCGLFGQSIVLN